MKLLINVLGLAAAGYFGYLLEPSLRPLLTGQSQSQVESGRNKEVILQMPGDLPQIELTKLTSDRLPTKVLLKSDVKFTDLATGTNMIMQAGNRVKLVRIEGGNAVVSPGEGPFYGLVPITDTDLVQQIAANPPGAATIPQTPVAPVIPTTGTPEESVKSPEAPIVPDLTSKPTQETSPTEQSPSHSDGAPSNTADLTIKAMQISIKAAEIKEFTFDQILDWKADADEIVDGQTYQTGIASYEAETIFGTKRIQAKALIKGGKVLHWVWQQSGMEIK